MIDLINEEFTYTLINRINLIDLINRRINTV